MKKISKTATFFIIAFVVTAAAFGVYTFFFLAMKGKTAATAELTLKNEELSGKESRVSAAIAALKEEEANIGKLSGYFVKENEIVAFAKQIESLGAISGAELSIEALDPGAGEGSAPYLAVRAKAAGSFEEVMHILALLENLSARIAWKSVQLNHIDEAPAQTDAKGVKKSAPRAPQWSLALSFEVRNFIQE